jgi:putative FmdB family regulatory protein
MPCYEWQCKRRDCRHQFEILCPAADREAHQDCPKCGGHYTQRVYSSVLHNWKLPGMDMSGAELRSLTEQSKKRWDDMQ